MMFAAVVGHCSGRATPSLRNAPPRQPREIVRRETIYRNRNAVQTNPATSVRLFVYWTREGSSCSKLKTASCSRVGVEKRVNRWVPRNDSRTALRVSVPR